MRDLANFPLFIYSLTHLLTGILWLKTRDKLAKGQALNQLVLFVEILNNVFSHFINSRFESNIFYIIYDRVCKMFV